MPSTPTTKSQVQAYRFVLRRMESALVRKDPVMLHDPMRSHQRATIVGVIVAVVGLVGYLLFGVFKPAPVVPGEGIVIAQPSGTIYVVSQNPRELIPVFNLASARLLLAAASSNGPQGGGGGGAPKVWDPTVVEDSQLSSFPTGRMTGIAGGPTVLPHPGVPATNWAVCDKIPRDPNAQVEASHPPQTTVLVGQSNIGASLTDGKALLVSSDGGKTLYLVYGLGSNVNNRDDSAVRAQLDTTDPNVLNSLNIVDRRNFRPISVALLNAIPKVGDIRNPSTGLNPNQPAFGGLAGAGLSMGQSFAVQRVGATQQEYYIAVPGGKEAVTATTAQIARYEESGTSSQVPEIRPDVAGTIPDINNGLQVDVSKYPATFPQVITADAQPVTCLGWNADFTDRQKPLSKTRVTVDFDLELPADAHGPGGHMGPVAIGASGSSGRIDAFFMNPALGGVVVRAASNAKEFGSGPIEVIDPQGVRFLVPDLQTAQVLGVADATPTGNVPPAPESIIGLLPPGGSDLSIQAVQRTVDGLPMPNNVGQFNPPPVQSGGGN